LERFWKTVNLKDWNVWNWSVFGRLRIRKIEMCEFEAFLKEWEFEAFLEDWFVWIWSVFGRLRIWNIEIWLNESKLWIF
jgi:hypothetical protein